MNPSPSIDCPVGEIYRRSSWSVIPCTTFRTALPALALVSVNCTNFLGPPAQLAAVTGVLVLGFRELKFDVKGLPLLAYIGIALVFAFATYGPHQAVIKGAKLLLFCLASCLSVRGATAENSFPALLALRAFLLLCAANLAFAVATGGLIFRGDYLIEFSIYSSYTLAFLLRFARDRLTLADRLATYGFCVLCGSTMGLFVLLIGEVLGRKLSVLRMLGILALLPPAWLALEWLMEVREKEMSLEYLATSDRGMILKTFSEVVLPTFSAQELIFGKGVGTPLHQFVSMDPVFDQYLKEVGEGAIYAFCLHNEPLRLLCDYGLVGLALVCLRLWRNCSRPVPVLLMLAACMMTNSYLYSFSGALIASSLFNTRPAPMPRATVARTTRGRTATVPVTAQVSGSQLAKCQ